MARFGLEEPDDSDLSQEETEPILDPIPPAEPQ